MSVLAVRPRDPPEDTAPFPTRPPYGSPYRSSSSDSLWPSHDNHTSVTTALSKQSRRSLATFAREKTSTAIANLASIATSSNQPLRSAASTNTLYKRSWPIDSAVEAPSVPEPSNTQPLPFEPPSCLDSPHRNTRRFLSNPIAKYTSYPESAPEQGHLRKMHQTSSRLLRMTEEERPFTRDFKDLFSTLIVSLPLTAHRVRFTRVEQTFTSEEAINNLGSLKFSQSNRMPDPKDPSRIVTTTTTTTFSMAKEMARSVCQRFLDARFIEPADAKPVTAFTLKGGVWQLTSKGVHILHKFCNRNGIISQHVEPLIKFDNMQLVILERDPSTDKLSQDRGTIEVIFRRFAGQDGPNVKQNVQSSDSDSLTDYQTGMIGVKMAQERKIFNRTVANSFTGKASCDWLMDCCTTIDRRETFELAEMFVKLQLMWAVVEDKVYIQQHPAATLFQPTKNAIYALTDRGKRICGWVTRDHSNSSDEGLEPKKDGRSKDSNNTRLNTILQDAALRLLFREFLRYSLCEENLSFYVDVTEFTSNYRHLEKTKALVRIDSVRETLAAAYGLYNAFLAPGSPCELNIDHSLRNSLASRMTRAVGDEDSMLKSLREVVELFELAQTSVFKLMSSDSVPKFLRDPKYANVLREHNLELGLNGRAYSPTPLIPERSMSRTTRNA